MGAAHKEHGQRPTLGIGDHEVKELVAEVGGEAREALRVLLHDLAGWRETPTLRPRETSRAEGQRRPGFVDER